MASGLQPAGQFCDVIGTNFATAAHDGGPLLDPAKGEIGILRRPQIIARL